MRALVLGGTAFVGRALVTAALQRGWEVTVLNRGTTDAPAQVHAVQGDRTRVDGLDVLEGQAFDVVLDTWSAAPEVVTRSADALRDRTGRYVYVSSRSVYDFPTPAGADETAPLVALEGEGYAQDKAGAEAAVVAAVGDRALLLRAGLILGPWENIGRLPWWLGRIARGGRVLGPGPPHLPLQLVDARDLASFALSAAAEGLSGPYDVVSPSGHATMGSLLQACIESTGSDAELVWVDPSVVEAAGVAPWTDLPVWLPPGELHDAMHGSDVRRALGAGLACRTVEETVRDTWAWMQSLDGAVPQRPDRPPVGLDHAVEDAILRSIPS